MSSISFREDLIVYLRSRLAVPRILLLWLALSACALWLSSGVAFFVIFSVMALLIAQFRLWDDLSDRKHDALRHPQRILVNTAHYKGFVWLCAALALPLAWMISDKILIYIGLLAAFSLLYAAVQARLLRTHLILLKYPIFIWLCARDANPEQWLRTGLIVYLLLCVHVLASDAELRAFRGWQWLAAAELATCAALLIF